MCSMRNLYFAGAAGDCGIYHYRFGKREDGIFLEHADTLSCPKPLYLLHQGDRLAAVLQHPFGDRGTSGLAFFSLDKNGSVIGMTDEPVDTLGVEACHLCAFQDRLYVTNYGSGSLYSTDGTLRVHAGHGPNPDRQEGPHTHFITPTPDGKYLLAVDLGLDTIFTYDADLREVSRVKAPDGAGPRHLVFDESGKYVFCANELANSVTVYAYSDGLLTRRETVSTLTDSQAESAAAAIRRVGPWIYVSNRGDDSIAAMYFDGETLTLRSVTPCGGSFPRDFDIFDGVMFVTNERPGSVTVFSVSGEKITKIGEEPAIPGCLSVISD